MGGSKNNSLIDEDAFFILDALEKNGYEARLVGGVVKDFFLKRKSSDDVDIATDATPTEVMNIFERLGLKTIPTGIKYGSATILRNDRPYEITTLREDVKTFGRDAEVKFSKSFEADSNRRDFTINAIYMDKNGKIYDYHSGVEDLFLENIRFVGDAEKRIKEDYLRILRYFRFAASHGDYKCDPKYLAVISKLKGDVKILSSERVVRELLKTFNVPDSYRIVPSMREVLDELFSLKFDSLEVCAKLEIFDSLFNVERLSMLLKFSSLDDLTRRYNFPRAIKEAISLKAVDRRDAFAKLKQTKKEYRVFYAKFLAVNSYLNDSEIDAKNFLKELLDFCQSKYADFKLSSEDLKEYDLTRDELKTVMIAAKKFWTDNDASRDECKKFAEEIVKKERLQTGVQF